MLFGDLEVVRETSRLDAFPFAIAPSIVSWSHVVAVDTRAVGWITVDVVMNLRVYERSQPVSERTYRETATQSYYEAVDCESFATTMARGSASEAVTRALVAATGDLAVDPRVEATLGRLEAQRQKAALAPMAAELAEMARYVAVARARSSGLTAEQRRAAQGKFEQGFELFRAGEFRAAVLRFDEGLEIDPANGVAHFYLGESHARLGEARRAAVQYRLTLELAPDTKEAAIAKTKLE